MKPWTNKEIRLLRKNFRSAPLSRIADQLPRHPVRAILRMAVHQGLTSLPVNRDWMAIARAHRPMFIFLPRDATA